MSEIKTYEVQLPTRIDFGAGRIGALAAHARERGKRAYLMIDPYLKGSALENDTVAALEAAGVQARLWHDIVPNPRAETCDRAAADLLAFGADLIIAIGGGSTMDAAKAVALVASNGGKAWQYTSRVGAEVRVPSKPGLPLIAVPTNAGTGAEVTPFAVLSNQQEKLKATIIHPFCFPALALIDPALHVTKPARLTASTGIDTFLHAIEGYIGNRPNGWTDLFAVKAMDRTVRWLPEAVRNPGNVAVRSHMAEACYMAGIALGSIGVGIPHALGQALGALKDTPHGESCAAFLVATVEWTGQAAAERLARVASLFDPSLAGRDAGEAAARLPDLLRQFFQQVGLDADLTQLGLSEAEIGPLLDVAQRNYGFDIGCSVRAASRSDLEWIVRNSLRPR